MRGHWLCIEENQMLCDPEDLRSEFNREIIFHNFSSWDNFPGHEDFDENSYD
jgi:hypothetical protein